MEGRTLRGKVEGPRHSHHVPPDPKGTPKAHQHTQAGARARAGWLGRPNWRLRWLGMPESLPSPGAPGPVGQFLPSLNSP